MHGEVYDQASSTIHSSAIVLALSFVRAATIAELLFLKLAKHTLSFANSKPPAAVRIHKTALPVQAAHRRMTCPSYQSPLCQRVGGGVLSSLLLISNTVCLGVDRMEIARSVVTISRSWTPGVMRGR